MDWFWLWCLLFVLSSILLVCLDSGCSPLCVWVWSFLFWVGLVLGWFGFGSLLFGAVCLLSCCLFCGWFDWILLDLLGVLCFYCVGLGFHCAACVICFECLSWLLLMFVFCCSSYFVCWVLTFVYDVIWVWGFITFCFNSILIQAYVA